MRGTYSGAAPAVAAPRPRGPHASGGCRGPSCASGAAERVASRGAALEQPRTGATKETGGGGGAGGPGQAGAPPSALPAAPATRPAHLRPGRQERGSERQVSQKFPGLRCHGGRHLKQETRRGGAGLRADKGGGGKEEGGGGPRGPFPSARARPLPSAACCRLLPRARAGLAPGRGFPACAPPVGAAGQYFGPPTPTPSSP